MDFRNSSSGNTAAKFLFCIKLINLTLLLFMFSLQKGMSQSNLVFVAPVYLEYSFASSGHVTLPSVVVPDSSVFKITSAGCSRVINGLSAATSMRQAFRIDKIVLSEVSSAQTFTSAYEHDLNIWIDEGTHNLHHYQTENNRQVECYISGVEYAKIPIQ
jgi:hypothetical protein